MKTILLAIILVLFIGVSAHSQTKQVYQYYFFMIQDAKNVVIMPDKEMVYPDIDSLIIEKREPKKVTYRQFKSQTEAFNVLASKGLEFVQYVSNNTLFGVATLWRRKI